MLPLHYTTSKMATIPPPRALLTSILRTLTSPSDLPPQPPSSNTEQPTNAFHNLSPEKRALLTTLHVLFPIPMLLQALDLLDRGLVVRVVNSPNVLSPSPPGLQGDIEDDGDIELQRPTMPLGTHDHLRPEHHERKILLHQVSSSQPPKSRFSHSAAHGAGGVTRYVVRTEAWHCSCAAFAYSSFPPSSSPYESAVPWAEESLRQYSAIAHPEWRGQERYRDRRDGEDDKREWGGRSKEGEGGIPLCKHLLAAVLGEWWPDVLGSSVSERIVASRDEGAGVGCE